MLNIDGNTTVRDLLTTYPAAFDVMASHGMCQSCKDNPPPVPLVIQPNHFAHKHCGGDLAGLIAQVVSVIQPND